MKAADLDILLQEGEDVMLECKEGLSTSFARNCDPPVKILLQRIGEVIRNALIADLLHRITFIEKAGSGIKRMREDACEQRCPAPIFEENGFFTAIFYPNPEVRAQAGAKEGPSTAQVGTKSGPSPGP